MAKSGRDLSPPAGAEEARPTSGAAARRPRRKTVEMIKSRASIARAIALFAGLVCAGLPAAAQQPSTPAAGPQFFPRYDFHLSAASLAIDDDRFSWDTHFGGELDFV